MLNQGLVDLEHQLLLITLLLYSNPTVPGNVVQFIVDILDEFIHLPYIPYLANQIKLNSKLDNELSKII